MPSRTKTVTLGDERDRLERVKETIQENGADADITVPESKAIGKYLESIEEAYEAVYYLCHGDEAADFDGYGEDAEVTVQALGPGEHARVKDRAADIRAVSKGQGGNPGASGNVQAAVTLQDGPMLEKGREDFASEREWTTYKMDVITEHEPWYPPGVTTWLNILSNELTSVDTGN